MFNLCDQLCDRYTSLNPFIVRKTKSGEVLTLIQRLTKINEKKEFKELGCKKGDQVVTLNSGKQVIYRHATNDNWY